MELDIRTKSRREHEGNLRDWGFEVKIVQGGKSKSEGRRVPTLEEVQYWQENTRKMGYRPDRLVGPDLLIDAWELRLVNSIARYRKLASLDAPEVILHRELGLISRCLAGVLGIEDIENFRLPSLVEVKDG